MQMSRAGSAVPSSAMAAGNRGIASKVLRALGVSHFFQGTSRSSAARTLALAALVALGTLAAAAAPAHAAKPSVSDQLPIVVDKTSATLRAKIDPQGLSTSYHFELGTDTSYGTRIPGDFDPIVGSGTGPVTVNVHPKGLEKDTIYHFRVVATNSDGTTHGPDQRFSTLNDDGLAWGRRYELVSPPDKGPSGEAGTNVGLAGNELQYQVSEDGNSIAYIIGYGLPGSTNSGDVAFRADRGPDGWVSTQVAPSLIGGPPLAFVKTAGGNIPGRYNHWLSSDLECGFSVSYPPLTADPEAGPVFEAGGFNLYRRNPDDTYDLVSNAVPTNPEAGGEVAVDAYGVDLYGASDNCDRVFFTTRNAYPGMPLTSGTLPDNYVYEWHAGVLSNPTAIPGPVGPEFPESAPPGSLNPNAYWNTVSDDGSRLFFTTVSKVGGDVGFSAVFVREVGSPTVDVSQSQTAIPNTGHSRYQMATPDGKYVFFTARYGLAPNGTSTGPANCSLQDGNNFGLGCDLYRYSVEDGTLIDVSVDTNPDDAETGAGVGGILDASADGSRVYFAAKGQLIPGKGQTQVQNVAAATAGYNVYLWDAGAVTFVATLRQADVVSGAANAAVLVSAPNGTLSGNWTSRATPDGRYLVFQSTAAIAGSVGGVLQAYRYEALSGKTECVSCRRDGAPALAGGPDAPLPRIRDRGGSREHPTPGISSDGRSVFFRKRDPLALGAVSGVMNLYEWREGQISLIAADIPGTIADKRVSFSGGARDGSGIFFRTKRSLVSQDSDGRNDIYVARVGGGFDEAPAAPFAPCSVAAGECQGAGVGPAGVLLDSNQLRLVDEVETGTRGELTVKRLTGSELAHLAAGEIAKLAVKVNRAGRITVIGSATLNGRKRRVTSSSRRAAGAGTVNVPIRLSSSARRTLARSRKLRIALSVRFSETRNPLVMTLSVKSMRKGDRGRIPSRTKGGAR
jgi:hypothetical protein